TAGRHTMKRLRSTSLAVASALLIAVATGSARPRYGGTLRVDTQGTLRALDPAAAPASAPERVTWRRVLPLIFEPLIAIESDGGLRPELAASWERDAAGAHWRVHLRPGVKLHDGSLLTPAQVAASLAADRPDWRVAVEGDTITIGTAQPQPELPWELAEPRQAIPIRQTPRENRGTRPLPGG